MRSILLPVLLLACGGPDPAPAELFDPPATSAVADTASPGVSPPPRRPRLYYTCGDPVCRGYLGPFSGVPSCGRYDEGDRCPPRAISRTCDPMSQCNALLECRRDPNPGPCPISERKHKRDIAPLATPEVGRLHAQLMDVELTRWRYNWEPESSKLHLGFILDDLPAGSPAAAEDGHHVDLYGYTSMVVAASQVQEQRIHDLETKVAELEALLRRSLAP